MSFLESHLLSVIVFLPLLGAVIALTFPRAENSGVRGFALAVTLFDLALAVGLWNRFVPGDGGMQWVESVEWIPSFGIRYSLAVDGLSLVLVLLTAFLAPLVVLSTYSSVSEKIRDYLICLLFLQTGMLGAFLATDLFLFYVFWEVMLVPMYFLVGIWGGKRRVYAALKFFLYTMAGSVLMLVAILYTVWAVRDGQALNFGLMDVVARLQQVDLGDAEMWLFLAFALAFAIKVPMFPFHTWLPDAHVEAPTGGSVILAGVLLKLGTYGFLRYAFGLFPFAAAAFLPALGLLAVLGILYGALVAMVQTDVKRLVAYSSVSHLGFVMLGLASMTVAGVSGGILQMVNHGISTGALFLLVGVLYERRHTRELDDFGGLAKVMPKYATIFVITALSSLGLPGLNGFVGEFLILMGAFDATGRALTNSTGTMATIGILSAQVLGLAFLLIVGFKLYRRQTMEQASLAVRIVSLALMTVVVLTLVGPPLPGLPSGLLLYPLGSLVTDTTPFAQSFGVLTVFAALGVIFAAVYLLIAVQKIFFGPLRHPENAHLQDLSLREMIVLMPLVLAMFVCGVYPQPLLDRINPTAIQYAKQFRERAQLPALKPESLALAPVSHQATSADVKAESGAAPQLPGSVQESPTGGYDTPIRAPRRVLPEDAGMPRVIRKSP